MSSRPTVAPTSVMTAAEPQKVERAIAKLKSLQDADTGVIDAIACGRQAVPALRQILFERERSGSIKLVAARSRH
jgi:hypothetical protein